MTPINRHWYGEDLMPDGAVSTGVGFTIAWQRGPLSEGRNGAFLIEVLESCLHQLEMYQAGKFQSQENAEAIFHLQTTLDFLNARLERRKTEGILGTHQK